MEEILLNNIDIINGILYIYYGYSDKIIVKAKTVECGEVIKIYLKEYDLNLREDVSKLILHNGDYLELLADNKIKSDCFLIEFLNELNRIIKNKNIMITNSNNFTNNVLTYYNWNSTATFNLK